MEPVLTMNVFNDEIAVLACPIMSGNLFGLLDPYVFSWVLFDSQGFVRPIDSLLYSNNNRTLTMFINDTTRSNQYRCSLRLRRCDISRTGGVPRCPVQTYEGPRIQFEVFGKLFQITTNVAIYTIIAIC